MGDNWNLDVKFQGRSIGLVGRLPAEKRVLLKDFPRKLVVSTKAKLAAIPHKGFFCKFFAKHGEEMKMYMKKNECALVTERAQVLASASQKWYASCLHALGIKRFPSFRMLIESLCTDRDGVMIGFIVSEVNSELEEKMHERQKVMQELVSTAKAMSNTFGDPMLEFDLLIDQLDTKPSAIQTSKGKSNIIYVVHDVIKSVRAGFPQNERNAKMRESPLVMSLGKVLYTLVQKLPEDARHCTNIRAVFDFWKKWGLEFSKPAKVEHESSKAEETMAKIDETFEILEKESNLLSDASTSPVKQIASAEVLALMKTHGIQPGPWEVYLSRATTQELEELDTVLTLNTKYYRFNNWDASDKGHRKCGEYFLHQYVKLHMPLLLKHSFKGSSLKRKRDLDPLQIYKQAFLCTWDLDQAAHRAVSDVERSVLDDIWKKMETEKCLNASAFVFGKIRRLKTIHFAKNPEIEAISKSIEDQDNLNTEKLVADMVRVFKLDTMAREGLKKVKARADLYKIAKELCDRCRHHMVANPSVHIVKLCQKAVAEKNPKKSYSSAMKSMMFRQMKLSALFAKEAQKKRKLENASPSTENDSSESSHADLTDAELAAVKRRIPKPPKLNFKKVDLSTITYRETNDNGTVGVAVSGIPNAGRGLFNLSDHAWPAFSVVCIFGVRRITKEQHHDGLNKVARCGELGETFVVVNGVIRDVEKFQTQYGHRLVPFDGLVDADGSVGGFPNDRVYEYPADVYWDASGFYNNCILVPGCIIENPQDPNSPITLNQLYIVTWKEVAVREEFFLAYGTSYYEEDEKDN
ncbi:hypothetical protein FI667_g6286, partial [Globisporangium splendens]